ALLILTKSRRLKRQRKRSKNFALKTETSSSMRAETGTSWGGGGCGKFYVARHIKFPRAIPTPQVASIPIDTPSARQMTLLFWATSPCACALLSSSRFLGKQTPDK